MDASAQGWFLGLRVFLPFSLFTDNNQKPVSAILFTNPPPSWSTESGHGLLLSSSHLISPWLIGAPKSSLLPPPVVPCQELGEYLVPGTICLSELIAVWGRESSAGREQCLWPQRSALHISSLSLSRKDSYLEMETMETHIHLLMWHLQMLHNKSLQVICKHM